MNQLPVWIQILIAIAFGGVLIGAVNIFWRAIGARGIDPDALTPEEAAAEADRIENSRRPKRFALGVTIAIAALLVLSIVLSGIPALGTGQPWWMLLAAIMVGVWFVWWLGRQRRLLPALNARAAAAHEVRPS